MNTFVQLSILLAALAPGASRADDAGLCKPMCSQEKRTCLADAAKMTRYETQPKYQEGARNTMEREFSNGVVRSNEGVGAAALDLQRRKATRNGVCEDKFATCAKACSTNSTVSEVLVKPTPAAR